MNKAKTFTHPSWPFGFHPAVCTLTSPLRTTRGPHVPAFPAPSFAPNPSASAWGAGTASAGSRTHLLWFCFMDHLCSTPGRRLRGAGQPGISADGGHRGRAGMQA